MEPIDNILNAFGKYVDQETVKQLEKPLIQLRSQSHIAIELLDGFDTENPKEYVSFRLKATQLEPTVSGRIFLQKEIVDLVKRTLEPIYNQHYYVLPITFSPDFSIVTTEWVNTQMKEHGLKNADIGRQTGINKSTLSELFTGRRPFTLMHKALFWHYFHGYRVAKSYQQALINKSNLPN